MTTFDGGALHPDSALSRCDRSFALGDDADHRLGLQFFHRRGRWRARHTVHEAVWGDGTGPTERFPRLVAHRPERVRALHRELVTWETERARYVSPAGDDYGDWFAGDAGDDYGDWFAGEFENVLRLYREASEHDRWITNNPDLLEQALAPPGLPRLPVPAPCRRRTSASRRRAPTPPRPSASRACSPSAPSASAPGEAVASPRAHSRQLG